MSQLSTCLLSLQGWRRAIISQRHPKGRLSCWPHGAAATSAARGSPSRYPGTVRRYRLRFRGPHEIRGFRWEFDFEEVRRKARVYLNGHLIGRHSDPYTPFAIEARGLRPGRENVLLVNVDNR